MPDDSHDRRLVELVDDGRDELGRVARTRQRNLHRQAEESARLMGALVDLAERGSQVTVRTTVGTNRHGWLTGVGADHVVLRDRTMDAYVRLAAVALVRLHPGERHRPACGQRSAPGDRLLLDVLARAVVDRPRVVLLVASGDVVSGDLAAVGIDVVSLRLDGDPPTLGYVPSSSVLEVLLRPG